MDDPRRPSCQAALCSLVPGAFCVLECLRQGHLSLYQGVHELPESVSVFRDVRAFHSTGVFCGDRRVTPIPSACRESVWGRAVVEGTCSRL